MKNLSVSLFLLVVVAYASPTRAGIFSSVGNQLNEAQEKITKTINGGIKIIQQEIEKGVEQPLQVLNDMKQEGENIIDSIRKQIDGIVTDLEEKANEITNGVDNNISDGCKLVSQGIKKVKEISESILSNISSCVSDKIDEANQYIEYMNEVSQEAINSLLRMNNESVECTKNINSIESIVSAVACLGTASGHATWAVTKEVPAIIINMSKMGFHLTTLVPSLGLCATTTNISYLMDEATNVTSSIKDCVNNQISANF